MAAKKIRTPPQSNTGRTPTTHPRTNQRIRLRRGRNAHRDHLRPLIEEPLSHKTAERWSEIFAAATVPCAPILTVPEGVQHAQALGLDPVTTIDGIPQMRNPATFSRTPVSYRNAPPTLGQHNP
ncbi:CoA transferase [Corynebacterium argentoratense]|uniref:CoA transferase n=1 Tax=Corynebacterium argentoratense TaxID=42817 RepID=UPI003C6EBC4F